MAIGRTNAGGGASLNFKIVSGGNFPPSMTRNMIPDTYAKTATYNGITYTVNGDGSITANGTATATSTCNVWGENNSLTLPAGTHTLSGCPAGGSQNTYMLCSNDTVRKDTGSGASFTLSADTAISFKIRIASGTTVSNLKFWPQLEQGSTKTSFVKYAQKENTIWVNTSVAIPSWAFSATEPGSPVAGMVWISTGTSSSAEFNALKKNAIQVYPASAKQYVGGAWSNVEAWLYQNGEWVQFSAEFDGYLYNAGVFNEDYAGDALDVYAKKYSSSDGNVDTPTVAYNSDNVTITAHYGNGYPSSMLVLQKKIDLTGFSELQLDSEHTGVNIYLRVWSEIGTYTNDNVAASLTLPHTYNTRMTDTLDISSLSGEYYCGVCILGSSSAPKLTMYAMKLE